LHRATRERSHSRVAEIPKHPGIIAPPPLMMLAALIAGFALDYAAPLGLLAQLPSLPRWIVGGFLILLAIAVNLQGFFGFQRKGTPVIPYKSATKLVTDGVFAHVRNPMYVGMVALPMGLGVALAGDWLVACAVLLWIVLHYGVVLREERYLETLFGDEYRAYKARVPRYGWRF
jgi:protein-S-isoprenylcysteine O-methyltransferase Ste14